MKISVITVCYNSQETIRFTLNSILMQTYKNIEHVIVDGGSKDETVNIIKQYQNKNKKIILTNGKGLYESINLGIRKSKGDLITILHSDDIYNNKNVLSKVAKTVKKSKKKIFFGNVVYFRGSNFKKVVRSYPANTFIKSSMLYGNMPPHTASFYKKEIFYKYGYYNTDYKIAGDFEHILRLIKIKEVDYEILNFVITRMKTGGLSGKNLNSFFIINKEILNTFKIHNIKSNILKILMRVPFKFLQYFFLDQIKLNKNFSIKFDKRYDEIFYNQLNIIQDVKQINLSKNFILSALNLAFLGSLVKNKIQLHKDLINWPDGIFSKIYNKKIKKIPGRQILKDLQIDNSIKKIIVLGNLSINGKKYLKNKFNLPVVQINLPYGPIEKILNKIQIKINKNELIFLTLPTPKQEQIANYLRLKNKYFKIICIGGSIGIASGDEKEVPRSLFYLEFLWRLRFETLRRIKRLIITFYQFLTDLLINKKMMDIKSNLINKNNFK